MTQHSVEERFCNQGQFNSSAALTLPDFALTLHTNPSHVVRRKTQSSGKEKYSLAYLVVPNTEEQCNIFHSKEHK